MKRVVKNSKGQVWIETVVYTLIAFAILGTVLSFARPKIQELQDKSVVEQSIKMLEEIDATVREVSIKGVGNKRQIELGIKKGRLFFNLSSDKIIFDIETNHQYSELDRPYQKGDINITTSAIGEDLYKIEAVLDYSGIYNLTWTDKENQEILSSASAAYTIFIENKGATINLGYL